MTTTPLNPLVGDGRTVIEASAGTGKTFTIAAAVARLVAEEGADLGRILVVTFTRAATAELKDRIRSRMVESLAVLQGEKDLDDEHFRALRSLDPEVAQRRLHAALSDFDRAQIFTIHGFAQRLLGQLGFRARLGDTLEPGEVDALVLRHAVSDLLVSRFIGDEPALDAAKAMKIGREVIGHPDAMVVPDPSAVEGRHRARVEMAHSLRAEVRRRLMAGGMITFDDGLIEVRDALNDAAVGDTAREILRRRYDIALVDESQDTDPLQWQIILSIFDGLRLVVIGDPKQSIYSFRGADIEAYLAAVGRADTRYTLDINWRSDEPLLRALDVLFEGATFGDPRIRYHRVGAPPGKRGNPIGDAPLVIRRISDEMPIGKRKNGRFLVGGLRSAVAADAASEIVELLGSGAMIEADEETVPLGPGHIAVLCRTRRQVELIRQELAARRVPSVTSRTEGVFITGAAEQWRRFLAGVERPDRIDLVRLATSTVLVGRHLADLAALDDTSVLELQGQMREWNRRLAERGVPALIEDLNHHTGLSARVLALPDGERLMTDLLHIAESMHAVWRRGRLGSLLSWLEATMAEAAERASDGIEEPDSRQRRLETDADAVTVSTIHGAKGLEYPVVLVPYAWDVSIPMPDIPVFHEVDSEDPGEPRRRLIDVAGEGWSDFDDHRRRARNEDAAEEARLLYVAMTRARHHLVVWWVSNHERIAEAKLTELLSGRDPDSLVAASGGTMISPLVSDPAPVLPYLPPASSTEDLEAAELERSIDRSWRRASFSSLSADQPLSDEQLESRLRTDEPEPDPELDAGVPAPGLPMADLPAGARFGTLVHEIFERVTFDSDDLATQIHALLDVEIPRSGWNFDPDELVEGLLAASRTPLGPSPGTPCLANLSTVLKELQFEMEVRTVGEPLSLVDIAAVMSAHLPGSDPYRRYAEDLAGSDQQQFRGYLTGAIDLVALIDGRYVVIDYKSNILPALGAVPGPGDYGPGPLGEVMVDDRYVLQATLYQVALHRYLQWRLPGYDPETHLGGSMYLFVRGMIGPDTPVVAGERCGVARWAPPTGMIDALSKLFRGEQA